MEEGAGLTTIVMLLASSPGQPMGNLADRLELRARLTSQGRLDAAEFGAVAWSTGRSLPDGRLFNGELVRSDAGWALRGLAGDDAPLWDFEGQVFRPGEYVTLRRPNGETLVYRIVDVRAA